MVVDLHSHSSVSDGTEPPADLVARAARVGIDVLAVTDHDTTEGLAEALDAGRRLGVCVVPGIEVSTAWQGADVHLLVYWPHTDDEALQQMLAEVRQGRATRIPAILARLAAHGIDVTEDEVARVAGDAASLGRPHVADALVAAGVVDSRDEAFASLIGEGMPGHVRKPAPPLPKALSVVRGAGGVPVLAHPWGRGSRHALHGAALAELAAHGLAGIEVDHVDHDDDTRSTLRSIAARLDLVVTGGSDYHGEGKAGVPLRLNCTAPDAFERLAAMRGGGR